MKKVLFVFLVCLLGANAGAEPLSQRSYVAFFLDGSHSSWCAMGSAPFTAELWIWVLPGQSGLGGVEFDVSYPASVEFLANTQNPDIPMRAVKCTPPCPDFAFPLVTCLTEGIWTWFCHVTLLVASSEPAAIEMLPFPPESPWIVAWNCEGAEEPAIEYSNVYLNYGMSSPACAGVAVEAATWGGIKALYR